MKSLTVQGPWAFYERRQQENQARIAQLETEVAHWKQLATGAQNSAVKLQAEKDYLEHDQLPQLQEQSERAKQIINTLHAELQTMQAAKDDVQQQLTEQVKSLTEQMQRLAADNAVLKSELAKTLNVKQSTAAKLEDVRKKLGMNAAEAKHFVQELDDARTQCRSLQQEVTRLSSDKAALQQQVDSRSQHCMTLIAENKRQLDQISQLRQQIADLQQDQQHLRRQLTDAQQNMNKPVVQRERPPWQAPKASDKGNLQNRPPWHDTSTSKAAKQTPIGLMPNPNAYKMDTLKQALAMRQDRLANQHSNVGS